MALCVKLKELFNKAGVSFITWAKQNRKKTGKQISKQMKKRGREFFLIHILTAWLFETDFRTNH